jgi:hypothetical protein
MMGLLEGRAEVILGEFNSQEVAITLWSMCFLRMHRSVVQCDLISSLVSAASRLGSKFCSGLNTHEHGQVHQFFVTCCIEESLGLRLPASIYALKADLGPACKAAFLAAPAQPSASQQQVSDTLRGMGLSVEDEFRCPKSGYSIDMRVQDKRRDLGVCWAIEFDGPLHFLACTAPNGATLIKRRHLELLGYILVSVPYWEWDGLSGIDERRKYLKGKLQRNAGLDSAAHSRQAPGRPRTSTQAGGGVVGAAASGGGGASESVVLSDSNGLGLIKPDTEQAKIDAHLEQQRCSDEQGKSSEQGHQMRAVTARLEAITESFPAPENELDSYVQGASEAGAPVFELDLTSHTQDVTTSSKKRRKHKKRSAVDSIESEHLTAADESRREPLAGPERLTNHSAPQSVALGFLFFLVLLLLYTEWLTLSWGQFPQV